MTTLIDDNPETRSKATAFIDVCSLTKVYSTPAGDVPALREVSLTVEQGEFVALLGKSGAGKSTLINMLSGIDRPTSGSISINGTAVQALTEDQLARWRGSNLGVVFQFFQLLPSISLIENITISMDFNGTNPTNGRRARALELLEQVGIAEHGGKVPAKISGGQQQRVAIARALANDPEVILADEPTGNLDSQTAAGIMDLFLELKKRGKTVFIVSHDQEVAQRADRIIHIENGRIASGLSPSNSNTGSHQLSAHAESD